MKAEEKGKGGGGWGGEYLRHHRRDESRGLVSSPPALPRSTSLSHSVRSGTREPNSMENRGN